MPAAHVPIHLDKPRTLIFDMEAMEAMEGALGDIPLTSTLQRLRGISTSTLSIALWAGLRADDKTLTLNLVKKIVKRCFDEGKSYSDLVTPVAEAIDKCGLFAADTEGNDEAATTTATT
jgi:hypothetical protein